MTNFFYIFCLTLLIACSNNKEDNVVSLACLNNKLILCNNNLNLVKDSTLNFNFASNKIGEYFLTKNYRVHIDIESKKENLEHLKTSLKSMNLKGNLKLIENKKIENKYYNIYVLEDLQNTKNVKWIKIVDLKQMLSFTIYPRKEVAEILTLEKVKTDFKTILSSILIKNNCE